MFVFVAEARATEEHFVSVKYFGFSVHPTGATNEKLMPLKFDRGGYLVSNLGVLASFERSIGGPFYVKVSQGVYFDCALQPAGLTHIGLRGFFVDRENLQIGGGIGPTFIWRKTWRTLPGYEPYTFYDNGGPIDYKFFWYGGELEYNQRLRRKLWLSVSLIPGVRELLNLHFGVRWGW